VLPPILLTGLRRVRAALPTAARPRWEYAPEGWQRARTDPDVKGWDVAAVSDRHRRLWPHWVDALEGTGTVGVDFWRALGKDDYDARSVFTDNPWAHNAAMSYGYVLALAARHKDRLSILDFGGGIGQFWPLTRALLPDVVLDYHVAETATMCELGRELAPELHFHESQGDEWQRGEYDLAVASGALQHAEDWRTALEHLAKATTGYVFVTRIPVLFNTPSFVVVHRADTYGFETEFLGWFVNRDEFVGCAVDAGLELVREFVMMDHTPAVGAPEQGTYRGFLFRQAAAKP
jgi:putative methyltransferase (TIGR04325 family)